MGTEAFEKKQRRHTHANALWGAKAYDRGQLGRRRSSGMEETEGISNATPSFNVHADTIAPGEFGAPSEPVDDEDSDEERGK